MYRTKVAAVEDGCGGGARPGALARAQGRAISGRARDYLPGIFFFFLVFLFFLPFLFSLQFQAELVTTCQIFFLS